MSIQILISTLGPFSIFIMLLIFGELSRRLGSVVRSKDVHQWFFVAAFLVLISVFVRLLNIGAEAEIFKFDSTSSMGAYYIAPLTLGLLLGVVTAWRYWGWLIYASEFTEQ